MASDFSAPEAHSVSTGYSFKLQSISKKLAEEVDFEVYGVIIQHVRDTERHFTESLTESTSHEPYFQPRHRSPRRPRS